MAYIAGCKDGNYRKVAKIAGVCDFIIGYICDCPHKFNK